MSTLRSQIILLITNNSFCNVQRATAQQSIRKNELFAVMVWLKLLRFF
jgi:hypothetical protein